MRFFARTLPRVKRILEFSQEDFKRPLLFLPVMQAQRILHKFLDRVKPILADNLEGLYLTGSMALNDFHPEKSDLDFIIVCKTMPGQLERKALAAVHREFHRNYPKPNLSGSYVPRAALRHPSPEQVIACEHGKSRMQRLDMAAITLWELKTIAVTVWGSHSTALPIALSLREGIARQLFTLTEGSIV